MDSIFLGIVAALTWQQLALLGGALALAFGFEFANGFHDSANAVASVIYTRTLKPTTAVVWSGMFTFLGTLIGGVGVAYAVVHLLPVEVLVQVNTGSGIAMVMALLVAAIIWNVGTWYFGIPASSSHTLIGSIVGVGMANSLMVHGHVLNGVNSSKLTQVALSLLISPVVGFFLSALLLLVGKWWNPDPRLHTPPAQNALPPSWIRSTLLVTCTGVSFAHGSNDGQKGMGLIMLILIGLLPAQFALNLEMEVPAVRREIQKLKSDLVAHAPTGRPHIILATYAGSDMGPERTVNLADKLIVDLTAIEKFRQIPEEKRWNLRQQLFAVSSGISRFIESHPNMERSERRRLLTVKARLRESVEYIPQWVILGVALCLGLGTMVGWRRVVTTVGEKIGNAHLTYSQGAAAEVVAMGAIGLADVAGLPVSTTHVLSSGVAGTMLANRSGLNRSMVKTIALAWILTIPVSMLLSGGLYWIFSRF
ncbi:MAG: inorganic phosphate transporter [Deltaproteobacteria bacterium]|nr:inorganic phosphate transporter [Deltaproteobacteria bacterium]MBI3296419.1 inorganic phosphate transporter [Deltaproteobacteria bacterium]